MAKKKAGKAKKGHKSRSKSADLNASEIFEEAEIAYLNDDAQLAGHLFQRALTLEPDNPTFLDGFGAFLAEEGDVEGAVAVLGRSVQVAPEASFEKYLYLGQLLEGSEAERAIRKGIQVLKAHLARAESAPPPPADAAPAPGADEAPSPASLREALCSALCSLGESVLSSANAAAAEALAASLPPGSPPPGPDAALPPIAAEAAAAVEAALAEANALLPASPEPAQALASLRISQGRMEDALRAIDESVAKWYEEDEEEAQEGGGGAQKKSASGASNEEDVNGDPPAFEFRLQSAQLLLTAGNGARDERAASILEGLVEENDLVPLVWYLLAGAYARMGEREAAAEAIAEGRKAAKRPPASLDPETENVLASFEQLEREMAEEGAEQGAPMEA